MAFQSVTHDHHNIIGNQREDFGRWTMSGTTGEIRTRLSNIDEIHIQTPAQTFGSRQVTCYLNTQTTTENTQGNGGVFHIASATNAVVYRYRAIGR